MIIRVFGYRGVVPMRMLQMKQFSANAAFVLDEPFSWGERVTLVGDVASESLAHDDPGTDQAVTLLRVEVPSTESVRYRIIPKNYQVVHANADCPLITGFDNFVFAPGWRISLIDARNLG